MSVVLPPSASSSCVTTSPQNGCKSSPLASGTPLVDSLPNPSYPMPNNPIEQLNPAPTSTSQTSAMPGIIQLNSSTSSNFLQETGHLLEKQKFPHSEYPEYECSQTFFGSHWEIEARDLDAAIGHLHIESPVAFVTQPSQFFLIPQVHFYCG